MAKNDRRAARKKKKRSEQHKKNKALGRFKPKHSRHRLVPLAALPDIPDVTKPNSQDTERKDLATAWVADTYEEITEVDELHTLLEGEKWRKHYSGALEGSVVYCAQEWALRAQECESPEQAQIFAEKALAINPNNADARYLQATAQHQNDHEAFLVALQSAVDGAWTELGGQSFIEESKGHFWDYVETRPYMRTRCALGGRLLALKRYEEARPHFDELLILNPADHLGMSYMLLSCLFGLADLPALEQWFEKFGNNESALSKWAEVLFRFMTGDSVASNKTLKKAKKLNPHVLELLLQEEKKRPESGNDFIPGGPEEATMVVQMIGSIWDEQPEAQHWLKAGGRVKGKAQLPKTAVAMQSMSHIEHLMTPWQCCFDSAESLRKQEPWEWMSVYSIMAVTDPATGTKLHVRITGNEARHPGVRVYTGKAGLAVLQEEITTNVMSLMPTHCLVLEFSHRHDLFEECYALIKQAGRRYRGKRVWPQCMSWKPTGGLQVPSEADASLLSVAMDHAMAFADEYRKKPFPQAVVHRFKDGESWVTEELPELIP